MSQATLATLGLHMDHITLTVPAEPAFHGTLRLVVGGIGSRSDLSYDQVNELQLAVEALVSHRAAAAAALVIEAELEGQSVSIALGPFVPEEDAGGRRVVERLVGRTRVVGRDDGFEWVELEVGARTEDRVS